MTSLSDSTVFYREPAYVCATCVVPLPNLHAAILHADDGAKHELAVYCPTCKRYQAADSAQVAAFTEIASNNAERGE